MRGSQRLFFGTAARLEESRVNNDLTKTTLVDNPAAHFLPEQKEIKKINRENFFENNFIYPIDISGVAWDNGYLFQYARSKKEKMEGVERLCLDSMSDPSSDWLL